MRKLARGPSPRRARRGKGVPRPQGSALLPCRTDRREAAAQPREGCGIQVQARLGEGDADGWAATAETWRAAGATHISATSMNAGFTSLDAHLGAIESWKQAVGG